MRAMPRWVLHSWCAADFNAAALNHSRKKKSHFQEDSEVLAVSCSCTFWASSPLWKSLENDPVDGDEVLRNHCSKDYLSAPSENIPDPNCVEYGDDLNTHAKIFVLMQCELKSPKWNWLKSAVFSDIFSTSLCFIHLEAHEIFPSSGQWGLQACSCTALTFVAELTEQNLLLEILLWGSVWMKTVRN